LEEDALFHRIKPAAKIGDVLETRALGVGFCDIVGAHVGHRLDGKKAHLGLQRAAGLHGRLVPAAENNIHLARLDVFEKVSLEKHQSSTAVAVISMRRFSARSSLTTTVARTGNGCSVKNSR